MSKKQDVLSVFLTFFKIGAFTFGGGYAMIPLIQAEAVQKHRWISDEDILDIVAIAESTPGPIAINSATFVGWRVAGVTGALAATVGVALPSLIVITLIAAVLRQFSDLKTVRYAFTGIRAGVLALILKALWSMYRKWPKSAVGYVIMAGAFVATAFGHVSALPVIVACALTGLGYTLIREGRKAK